MSVQKNGSGLRRAKQVFQFLRAFNAKNNPVIRQIDDQPWRYSLWDLPDHPAISVKWPADEQEEGSSFVMEVHRANRTGSPSPPKLLEEWVKPGWRALENDIEVYPSRLMETGDETVVENFADDDNRRRALQSWKEKRDLWVKEETPARDALNLFEQLYELHGRLSRKAEKVELVIGNGILNWRVDAGGIHHPILFRRLQLSFDPEIPAFTIQESEPQTGLYSSLFRVLPNVEGEAIADLRAELEQFNCHPIGEEDTTGFLKRLVHTLSSDGQYCGEVQIEGENDYPRVGYEPILFLRNRVLGFATAIEGVLNRIECNDEPDGPLKDIIGVPRSSSAKKAQASESKDVLLSKPANKEQRRVVERLERYGAVVVQGPPGTGKTHTIGNLIGHLLAQGKSILVTSHTSKALRRVREQVAEPLRSLCVSALGADVQSRKELEHAVTQMASRLGEYDVDELQQDASLLASRRADLKEELAKLMARLSKARQSEYEKIVVGDEEFHPTEAAKKVKRERAKHGWIPGPVESLAPPPLSENDFAELYATNRTISAEAEEKLRTPLPPPNALPAPARFEEYQHVTRGLNRQDLTTGKHYWGDSCPVSIESLRTLRQDLSEVLSSAFKGAAPWELAALEAGRSNGVRRETWSKLLEVIQRTVDYADTYVPHRIAHDPQLSDESATFEQLRVLREILRHLDAGRHLSVFTLLWHSEWKKHIKLWRTNGMQPETKVEFVALKKKAVLERLRSHLIDYWERLVADHDGHELEELGTEPEEMLRQYSQLIEAHLNWYDGRFKPLVDRLKEAGLAWDAVYHDTPPVLTKRGALHRLREAGEQTLKFIDAQVGRLKKEALKRWKRAGQQKLQQAVADSDSSIVLELYVSFQNDEVANYRKAYNALEELAALEDVMQQRNSLLKKVGAVAPRWANHIRDRVSPHDRPTPSSDPIKAWHWRQLRDELDRRAAASIDAIQRQIDTLESELLSTTQRLIKKLSWKAQIERIQEDNRRRQALVGWADTQRKIGKGYGKKVPKLRREARKQMDKCREAVPAWIMPLTGVVENFDAQTTQFDVAIIDEASQVDVTGLLLLYLAKQVVIVGDHKQVSPSAVGEKVEEVDYLREEYLQGIPNNHLYDGKTSIYDLARQSFGGAIGLREHFRCVPEIIQFSNALSYDFEIKPLRDASTVELHPPVVAHRVQGATYKNKVNEKEAFHVASLVAAATEDPAYDGKSIGVVSLVGEEQAERIERLLRTHLPPVVFEQDHQILTGNPAQFQGDERDVMFVTIVNAPDTSGGPLPMRTQTLFEQRFNVAASRARDQMWVVHSLDPKTHLKQGDLRRRLIEHAQDPTEIVKLAESEEHETESPFERKVLRRLRKEGYRVKPQWPVGAYRIDLVVVGSDGTKVAVECDGERYHPPEKLEEDMERQGILERLGWTFVRIRGSVFFRDPDRAMQPVFDRLEEIGIDRAGSDEQSGADEVTSEVKDRIVRRAAELRRAWANAGEEELEEWSANSRIEVSSDSSGDAKSSNRSGREQAFATRRTPKKARKEAEPGDLFESVSEVNGQDSRPDKGHTRKPNVRKYDRVKDIPDAELFDMLFYYLPDSVAVERESALRKVAAAFGFELNSKNRRLRSRLNKYIQRQINAGKMKEINDWEKIQRVA